MAHNPLRAIRFWLVLFMAGLFLSGVTAFPLQTELHWVLSILETAPVRRIAEATHLLPWIARVHHALSATNAQYPFLAYGTDWLAFAHLVLAVLFIGPYRDPVRNKWIITFALIACGGVIPLVSSRVMSAAFRSHGDSLIAVLASSERFLSCVADNLSPHSSKGKLWLKSDGDYALSIPAL